MLDPSPFAYNAEAPVELTILSEHVTDGCRIQDVSYKSPIRGKVSAYLIVPPEPQPQAGLIFGHWGQGNRGEFMDEAVAPAHLGCVSFCLDAPFRRPEAYEPAEDQPAADLQWIVDVRRAIDIFQERFELSPEHLGYVGHSYGASLLFQFARQDDFVSVQQAEHYFALASDPKQIAWYEHCNHELSKEARLDRVLFLCQQLGLPFPSQQVLDLLEQIPPPVPMG